MKRSLINDKYNHGSEGKHIIQTLDGASVIRLIKGQYFEQGQRRQARYKGQAIQVECTGQDVAGTLVWKEIAWMKEN